MGAVRVGAGGDGEDIHAAPLVVLARWQSRAENPLSDQAVKDAARVVIRTCEGMMQT